MSRSEGCTRNEIGHFVYVWIIVKERRGRTTVLIRLAPLARGFGSVFFRESNSTPRSSLRRVCGRNEHSRTVFRSRKVGFCSRRLGYDWGGYWRSGRWLMLWRLLRAVRGALDTA
jgi:hypothetical protein